MYEFIICIFYEYQNIECQNIHISAELLRVIKETENDDLTSVMSKLITTYGDQEQVAGIAVDIAQELVSGTLGAVGRLIR